MLMEERRFASLPEAAHALAGELAQTLEKALSVRGRALLAVSGGRTPQPVFERLRQRKVDWGRVTLTLTDERWVASDHPDSNENLLRSALLRGPAAAAAFVPLFGGEESPEAGQPACEARLRTLALPFDAVYLGIGSDGHFASLFPGDPALDARDSLCVAVPAAGSRLPRMSLTAPALLNSEKLFIMFAGRDKETTYIEAKKTGSCRELPLRLLLSQPHTPVFVLLAP